METHRTLLRIRWVKLWTSRIPALPDQNGNWRLLLRIGKLGIGAGLITRNQIGCDRLRIWIRTRGTTLWLWRFGCGLKWGDGTSQQIFYRTF